jgi:hypothetical protein
MRLCSNPGEIRTVVGSNQMATCVFHKLTDERGEFDILTDAENSFAAFMKPADQAAFSMSAATHG